MNPTDAVVYTREATIAVADFQRVLVDSGLGAIRPVDDLPRLQTMLDNANLIVTARRGDGELIGVARCFTDFSWSCYLSELAVSPCAQGLGIGKGLLDETRRQLGPTVSLILASVPEAVGFYERAGMARIHEAFWYKRER
jgi:ribosomal protein S18 acetylase RimI-like enzyme